MMWADIWKDRMRWYKVQTWLMFALTVVLTMNSIVYFGKARYVMMGISVVTAVANVVVGCFNVKHIQKIKGILRGMGDEDGR